jgi:predicted RecB family nuclease
MPVNASTLYDLVQCPQRVALDAFGDRTQREVINPFVRLLWERGTLFERETISNLERSFTDLSEAHEIDRERLTFEAIARGDSLIYGGQISADELLGMPDLLRKESEGYVPGDIKSGRGKEGGSDENDGNYFYSKYERTIYRKLQQKYPGICTPEDIERLFEPSRAVDLYGDVVLKATEWPTLDHSIKTLAKYLGFSWRDTHPSGAASVEWFDRWCRERKPELRQRILDYNEDDCRATRILLDGIRDLAA